jgi:hypothetical protein
VYATFESSGSREAAVGPEFHRGDPNAARIPAERGLFSLLIRAAVLSPAAAEVLVRMDLRTKAQRRAAVVAATVAMAAEIDAGEAQ